MKHRQRIDIKQRIEIPESWSNIFGKGLIALSVVLFYLYFVAPAWELTK